VLAIAPISCHHGEHLMSDDLQRDLIGYADRPPRANWPGDCRLAVNFVLNYEEGAEYTVLNGDAHSETILSEVLGLSPRMGLRDPDTESMYEYGSRVGVWRILKLFAERRIAFTCYAVGRALELNPRAAEALAQSGCDFVGHGWRWIDHLHLSEEVEREHIARCVEVIRSLTGERPRGWYTGRPSLSTRRLVVEEGGFLFDCDAYNDDLPYYRNILGRAHLIMPHCFDTNDSRYARAGGFAHGDDYFTYARDTFDWLYAEGAATPRIATFALHCRIVGLPGRMGALARFVDYVAAHDGVWIARRTDIARHWLDAHPPQPRLAGMGDS